MIYAVLPVGSLHGWGVCGKYIVKELSKFTEVRLLTDEFTLADILDDFDFRLLKSKLVSDHENQAIRKNIIHHVDFPVLQSIRGNLLKPPIPGLKGNINIGYTFFEKNILSQTYIENGRRYFDIIVAGSSWCEEILRGYGFRNTKTVIQGIDPRIFNPFFSDKEYFQNKFVIFSGGKFELRKGQDIVIKAFKILREKYKDVLLITSWFNSWPHSLNTMHASPYITFNPTSDNYFNIINQVLDSNGIDPGRVIILPPYPNVMLPRIYKNTDIGLFPNRCEGGTNLVLMEYMACAKPVIASFNSGHKDILTDKNSIKLVEMRSITITNNNINTAVWDEPTLDETIAKLEWAYNNRDSLQAIGIQAGEDLSKSTWGKTSQHFYELLTSHN